MLRREHNVRVQNIKAQHAAWTDRQLQHHKEELLRQQQQLEAQVCFCLRHIEPVLSMHIIFQPKLSSHHRLVGTVSQAHEPAWSS